MRLLEQVDAAVLAALRPRGAETRTPAAPVRPVSDADALAAERAPPHVTGEARLTDGFARACADVCRVMRDAVGTWSWLGVYVVEGDELVLAGWDGPEATEHVRIPMGNGICGAAASSGETIVVDDVNADPRYLSCFVRTKSELVVPIRLGGRASGRIVGEIDIDSDEVGAFGDADRLLVESIADRLGIAYEQVEPLGPIPRMETRAVRSQWGLDGPVRPIATPISASAIYELPEAAVLEGLLDRPAGGGYLYSRWGNPTVAALERTVADLEGAERALAFASGMGAIAATLLAMLKSGDEVVAQAETYGETTRLLDEVLPSFGVRVKKVGVAELSSAPEAAIGDATRLVYAEVLTNPLLRVLDLPAVAKACRAKDVPLVIDNTFLTPCALRPLEHGASVVIHSATKFLSGHSDVVSGVVCGDAATLARIEKRRRAIGAIASPFDAFLVARGIKTLPLRVERQQKNALALARHLEDSPPGIGVERVIHPALEDHPEAALAQKMWGAGCALVAFEMDGGIERARRFFDALAIARRAASLGSVETLVSLPILTSHHGLAEEHLRATGIGPGCVRVSVGLEDPFELARDIVNALEESQS